MWQFSLTVLFLIPIIVESSDEWSYINTKQWSRKNRYCAGNSQSPIDLRFNISHHDHRLKRIHLDEQQPQSQEQPQLVNNGHTAQLNLPNYYVLKHVAPSSEDYKVEQIHFHWGHSNDNRNGSEHLHEGQAYPLEMHVVSYSSLYSNIREAMPNIRGLAVVGLFFEVIHEPNPLFQPLVDALKKVRDQDQQTTLTEEFNLKELIGEERLSRYYRYDGSLTTPPCYESVIWTVLVDPIKISLTQLHAFRYLHNHNAKLIENTYRPVKPLGTRILFRSFFSKDIEHDFKERMVFKAKSNGQYLMNNMKLIIGLIGLLIIVL
jgi:carbonic anhydrase